MNKPKIIKLKNSGFEYDSKIWKMYIYFYERFCFNENQLLVDDNPYGDPILKPMNDISFKDDGSEFCFTSMLKKQEKSFVIKATKAWEKTTCLFMKYIYENGFSFLEDVDYDQVELSFVEDTEFKCILRKTIGKQYKGCFYLYQEDGIWYYLQPSPFGKFDIKSMEITDDKIICNTEKQNFEWSLQLQPQLKVMVIETLKARFRDANLLKE